MGVLMDERLRQQAQSLDIEAERIENPEPPPLEGEYQSAQDQRAEEEASLAVARQVMEFAAFLVVKLAHLEWPAETIEQGATKLAPILRRPYVSRWVGQISSVERWRAEIDAGVFFGMLVIESVRQYRSATPPPDVSDGTDQT